MNSAIASVEDLRQLAIRRVPRALFGYVESGAYFEQTLRANRTDLDALCLRQRVLSGLGPRDLSTTMLGQRYKLPVALAPTGMAGLIRAQGEILGARAAEAAGVPFTLSTVSVCSIEAVRAAVTQPFWFQLYIMRERDVVRDLIARARAAACSALVVTVDLPLQAERHRDLRSGMGVGGRFLSPANILDIASKPRWVWHMLKAPLPRFGNLQRYLPASRNMRVDGIWGFGQLDDAISWQDLAWVRGLWPGKLIVKGILDADDARRAVDHGADAIVVSNHGGRQLDGAPSSIAALPQVANAVGARCELLLDSGIRSGTDVLKALACGARGVLLGRNWLYGLGAMGQPGVSLMLDLIRKELDTALTLTGTQNVTQAGPHLLWPPAHPVQAGGTHHPNI